MAAIAARDIGAPLPKVWLRIDIDGEPAGIVTFVLRADVAPRASENFRGLCTGEYGRGRLTGKPLSFAGTAFFRIIPGMMAVGGDIENNDGTGGECVFEQGKGALAEGRLADESFLLRHTGRGVLSTAVHRGPDTGASAFNLTFAPCRLLDERAVVFGYAVAGRGVLDRLEACGDAAGWPTRRVTVGACGQMVGDGTAQVARPGPMARAEGGAAAAAGLDDAPRAPASARPGDGRPASGTPSPGGAISGDAGAASSARAATVGPATDSLDRALLPPASAAAPNCPAVPHSGTGRVAHYTTENQAWPTGPGPARAGAGSLSVAELRAKGRLPLPLAPLHAAGRQAVLPRAGTGAPTAAAAAPVTATGGGPRP